MGAPFLHAVVPDLPGPGPGDEGFAVDADGTDLSGWSVTDGKGTWHLSPCQAVCWFTGNASTWTHYGGPAATEWNATGLRLANAGDSLRLLDPDGVVVDEVAWGTGTDLSYRSPGALYLRSGDGWITPRIHRIGESDLDRPTFDVDRLTLYASPDSSFQVLSGLIADASERLHLHVHDLDHVDLVDAMVQAKEGRPDLDLAVLVDGRVPGRSNAEESKAKAQWGRIVDAGGNVVLAEGGRYAHHHLKVLIADDAVAVQSENWNAAGVPVDPSWGNRGWGVVVHDAGFADWMVAWMEDDRTAWDVDPLTSWPDASAPRMPPPRGDHDPVPTSEVRGSFQVTPIISPDHTADPRHDPLLAAMEAASTRIVGQQLRMDLREWNRLGWDAQDRYVTALTHASGRGVDVQVMLAGPFGFDDVNHHQVATALQEAGVDTTLWDHPDMRTLHNKGWVIDDAVYVGSMNGNHASRSANREVGVLIEDAVVADWYASLAASDQGIHGDHVLPVTPVPILLVVMAVARVCRPF